MAHDTYKVNVGFVIRMPDYEFDNEKYTDRTHHNKEQKAAIVKAVLEQLMATMPMVIVDGEEYPVECITNSFDPMTPPTEVHLTDEELKSFSDYSNNKDAAWDAFHEEIARREEKDRELFRNGVYSMGDLWGPISQLDEVVHVGFATVVINNGRGDEAPVYSSSAISNPTNWDMFRLFCQAVRRSNDKHHIFLEGIRYERTDADGVSIYEALTGS